MFRRIVVGIDGSPASFAAVRVAAELASRFGARLYGVSAKEGFPRYSDSVTEVREFHEERDSYFETAGERAKAIAAAEGVLLQLAVEVGSAATVIADFAEEVGADLVVIGRKKHSRLGRVVSHHTGEAVSAASRASVLIVAAPDEP